MGPNGTVNPGYRTLHLYFEKHLCGLGIFKWPETLVLWGIRRSLGPQNRDWDEKASRPGFWAPLVAVFQKDVRTGARPKGSRTQRLSAGPERPAAAVGVAARAVAGRRFAARLRTVAAETQRAVWRAGGARCAWACLGGAALPAPPQPGRSPPGPAPAPRPLGRPGALGGQRRAREQSGPGMPGAPPRGRRRRYPVCRRCAPLTRGDEIPGLRAGVRVPVRGRDDGGAVPEQHLPLGRGRHVASADAAFLAAALRARAAHAPLRAPRLQPRPAARAAAAPAATRAALQVRAGPRVPSPLPWPRGAAFREGRVAGLGAGPRPAQPCSSGPTVPVTRMRQNPGRVGIKLGRTAAFWGSRVWNCQYSTELGQQKR